MLHLIQANHSAQFQHRLAQQILIYWNFRQNALMQSKDFLQIHFCDCRQSRCIQVFRVICFHDPQTQIHLGLIHHRIHQSCIAKKLITISKFIRQILSKQYLRFRIEIHQTLGRSKLRNFHQFLRRVIREIVLHHKSRFQAWIRLQKRIHLLGIPRHNDCDIRSIGKFLQQYFNGFFTKIFIVFVLASQSIRLIDKQDSVLRLLDCFLRFGCCLSDIFRYQITAIHFNHVTFLQQPHLLVNLT